jgi:hypothetical protein
MNENTLLKPPATTIDSVTLAVIQGRLEQVADEMDATLYRTAFNPIIAEAHDACQALEIRWCKASLAYRCL